MISLGEEMQIDLAHDRAVAVGIAHELLGAIPAGDLAGDNCSRASLGKVAW